MCANSKEKLSSEFVENLYQNLFQFIRVLGNAHGLRSEPEIIVIIFIIIIINIYYIRIDDTRLYNIEEWSRGDLFSVAVFQSSVGRS